MENEFHVKSNNGEYQLVLHNSEASKGTFEGEDFELDIVETATGFHVIKDGKGHEVDVIHVDPLEKTVRLRIDHKFYDFTIRDRYDELLTKLGMERGAIGQVADVKAPMPGLVLDVMIQPGDKLEVDQPILILEAMKMENVIKAPSANVVKSVSVTKGQSVEKNQILVEFD